MNKNSMKVGSLEEPAFFLCVKTLTIDIRIQKAYNHMVK